MSFADLFNHKESKAMAKSVTFKLKRGQSVTLGGITLAAVWSGHEGSEPNLTLGCDVRGRREGRSR